MLGKFAGLAAKAVSAARAAKVGSMATKLGSLSGKMSKMGSLSDKMSKMGSLSGKMSKMGSLSGKMSKMSKMGKMGKMSSAMNKMKAFKMPKVKMPSMQGLSQVASQVGEMSDMSSGMSDMGGYEDAGAGATYEDASTGAYDTGTVQMPYRSSGTSISTYLLIADVIFFLIGVILIMSSQTKCKENPNGDTCKSHKNWGIGILVITSILLIVIIYFKFK